MGLAWTEVLLISIVDYEFLNARNLYSTNYSDRKSNWMRRLRFFSIWVVYSRNFALNPQSLSRQPKENIFNWWYRIEIKKMTNGKREKLRKFKNEIYERWKSEKKAKIWDTKVGIPNRPLWKKNIFRSGLSINLLLNKEKKFEKCKI